MKKLGYTLAEVLITLAVIGVVAALAIPMLTTHHHHKTYAASIAAGAMNFENAMSALMAKDGVSTLFETKAWKELDGPLDNDSNENIIKKFMNNVGSVLPLTSYSTDIEAYYDLSNNPLKNVDYQDIDTSLSDIVNLDNQIVFESKNGMAYMISVTYPKQDKYPKILNDVIAQGGHLASEAAQIVIDINGKAKPNAISRDMFFFILGSDGKLYPYGGKDVSVKLAWLSPIEGVLTGAVADVTPNLDKDTWMWSPFEDLYDDDGTYKGWPGDTIDPNITGRGGGGGGISIGDNKEDDTTVIIPNEEPCQTVSKSCCCQNPDSQKCITQTLSWNPDGKACYDCNKQPWQCMGPKPNDDGNIDDCERKPNPAACKHERFCKENPSHPDCTTPPTDPCDLDPYAEDCVNPPSPPPGDPNENHWNNDESPYACTNSNKGYNGYGIGCVGRLYAEGFKMKY